MSIVIHHNPACGTSSNVLAIIRATGEEPVIIDYLKEGWTRPQLLALFAAAGISAKEALRTFKTKAEELGLTQESVTNDDIIDAMVADPVLVNRPIVVTAKGVALCRPAASVLALLEKAPVGPVAKADGKLIVDKEGNVVV